MKLHRMASAVISAVSVAAAIGIGPTSAWADPLDPVDPAANTGDSDIPTPSGLAYVDPVADVQAKETAIVNTRVHVTAFLNTGQPAPTPCMPGPCNGPPPRNIKLTQGSYLTAQQTGYTCAPASTRSILWHMTGTNHSEASLASAMKTTSNDGTYYKDIKIVINQKQSRDVFVGEPEFGGLTPEEIMTRVVFDTAENSRSKHAVMLNVDQSKLKYWNRTAPGKHYNVAYGYNLDSKKLAVGDIWSGAGIFGEHIVLLSEVHLAVLGNKGLVIW